MQDHQGKHAKGIGVFLALQNRLKCFLAQAFELLRKEHDDAGNLISSIRASACSSSAMHRASNGAGRSKSWDWRPVKPIVAFVVVSSSRDYPQHTGEFARGIVEPM
jgi:hypothetical protein